MGHRLGWLFILCILLAPRLLHAQTGPTQSILEQRITLGKARITAYEALNRISDSIGYHFVYDSKLIPSSRYLRIDLKNVALGEAIRSIVRDTSIRFETIGKHIVIYKPDSPSVASPKAAIDTATYILLQGRIIDSQTQRPLPYATVGIAEQGVGISSNSEGRFALKIPKDWISETLQVSHIGYKTQQYPVGVIAFNPIDIALEVQYISIQEVVIRNFEPNRIVRESIESIPHNFSASSQLLTIFYREGVLKNSGLLNYSEGVFEVYKAPYTPMGGMDQAKMLKARKFVNSSVTDTFAVKLKGGMATALQLDVAKNIEQFFNTDMLHLYVFSKSDIVVHLNRSAYAINFEQHPDIKEPLLKGTLYIDMETLALVRAEFQVNPTYIHLLTDKLVTRRSRKLEVKPESASYLVEYHWHNGKCYLAHIRGDLGFRYRKRRHLFYGRFTAFLEMATTHIDTLNAKRFDHRVVERASDIFINKPVEYDESFWCNFNIIPPEANLYEALRATNWLIELPKE